MSRPEPSFTLGIEEEYLVVDAETLDLVAAPEALMQACVDQMGKKVSPGVSEMSDRGRHRGLCNRGRGARRSGAVAAPPSRRCAMNMGWPRLRCRRIPLPTGTAQRFTDKERYRTLEKDLAGVALADADLRDACACGH